MAGGAVLCPGKKLLLFVYLFDLEGNAFHAENAGQDIIQEDTKTISAETITTYKSAKSPTESIFCPMFIGSICGFGTTIKVTTPPSTARANTTMGTDEVISEAMPMFLISSFMRTSVIKTWDRRPRESLAFYPIF
jgi:hypothetical protein